MKYDKEEVVGWFYEDVSMLDGCEIVFAEYAHGYYSGAALVIYVKDSLLYEVNGSHCSCRGLEGQWHPEETNANAIKMRLFDWADADTVKSIVESLDKLDGDK